LSSLLVANTAYIIHISPAKANLSLKPAYPFCSPAVQNNISTSGCVIRPCN